MALNGTQAYALSKKYTEDSLDGVGALKGAPCTIKSYTHQNGRSTIVFEWTSNSGVVSETTVTVLDGTPIYEWQSGDFYDYSDLVIYASCFYRCITPNSDVEFDDTKWNELGSADGNYDIVQNSTLLPSIFTAADRKMYYSIEDEEFYFWNGFEWVIQKKLIQYDALPTASSTNVNEVVQYLGATSGGLTHGYFYECVEDSGNYSWNEVKVQDTHVEASETNGNLVIDGVETTVYDDTVIDGRLDDVEQDLSTDSATVTGNPLNFTTLSAQKAEQTQLLLEPIQDLHGYDKPWVGGAGKNKLKLDLDYIKSINTVGTWSDNTYTINGIAFTVHTDNAGNITKVTTGQNQTATGNVSLYFVKESDGFALPAGDYIGSGCPSGGSASTYFMRFTGGFPSTSDYGEGTGSVTCTNSALGASIRIIRGATVSNLEFLPMIRLATETDATFEPYENICPISGRNQIGILGTNGKQSTDPDYVVSNNLTIQFGQTVYGGTLDVESGVLTVTDGYIASYNGETLPSTWISDRDEYAEGTTPTTGAQVCYKLVTPTTIQLTQNQITLLAGVNNISTDGDSITLTYRDGKVATLGDLDELNTVLNGALTDISEIEGDITSIETELDTKADKSVIQDMLIAQLDGTKATYDRIMKTWFDLYDAENCTPAQLTELCEQWYTVSQRSWDGNVTFDQPNAQGASQGSTGTRGGDNVGMSCTPSTDEVAGADSYAGHPLFACTDVNYTVDATTLDIVITAIDGITSGFERNNPDKYVGVMQATGWRYEYENESTYTEGYRDSYLATYEHIAPLPEAVRVDGTVRKFVVHSKYMSSINGEKMTSCAGTMTQNFISHNSLHTFSNKNGAQYSGGTTVDLAFLKLMTRIKYASLTLDGIMNGCLDYNLQYYAQVSETGVKRIILPASCSLLVGSTIMIGTYNGSSADRGTAANYNISGQRGVVITAIEDVTINETAYKAVTVDIANAFDTTANGSATAGTTIVSTLHWKTGSCDGVLGNDGSPVSNTNSKYPRKLQGIEFNVGGYEVLADVIMNEELIDTHSHYVPAIVKRSARQATSITANYAKIYDLAIANPAAAGWQYIKKEKYANGMYFPNIIGGSSSTFTKDAFYMDKDSTTGTREYLAFGYLLSGLANGGLSYLSGGNGLAHAHWASLARLSPNGNRGEWTAS